MSPVTYGDLLTRVAGHIDEGVRRARVRRFDTSAQARKVLAAYHGLLAALEAHTWALVRPARLTGAANGADPIERASVELAGALRDTTGTQDPHPSLLTPPDHPWAHAAMTLRAASDLLAVHHTASGRPRSPDAAAWADAASRTASLIHLARLTGAVLEVEDTLALRAGQSHLSWAEVSRWLPGLDDARSHVAAVLAGEADPTSPSQFAMLGLLGEPVRTDTPVHELTDRITRLRHLTWDRMAGQGHPPATLRDLATLAAAVNAHAAAHLRAVEAGAQPNATALIGRARSWQGVARDLADYVSPAPADPEIRAHIRQLIGALHQISPLTSATRQAHDGPATAALRAALAGSEQIGRWADRSFDRLASQGHLTVCASSLAGKYVTDEPALAAAKLAHTRVIAPPARLAASRALYAQALQTPNTPTVHRLAPALGATAEAMIIGRRTAG